MFIADDFIVPNSKIGEVLKETYSCHVQTYMIRVNQDAISINCVECILKGKPPVIICLGSQVGITKEIKETISKYTGLEVM